MFRSLLLCFILLFIASHNSYAHEHSTRIIKTDEILENVLSVSELRFYTTDDSNENVEQIQSNAFQPIAAEKYVSILRNNPKTLWLRFAVTNRDISDLQAILRIGANVYAQIFIQHALSYELLGEVSPDTVYKNNELPFVKLPITLSLLGKETAHVFVKLLPNQIRHPVLEITTPKKAYDVFLRELIIVGVFTFTLVILGLVNITNFTILKRSTRTYYALHMGACIIATLSLTGFALPLLWQDIPGWDDNVTTGSLFITKLTAVLLMLSLFDVKQHSSKLFTISTALAIALFVLAVTAFINPALTNALRPVSGISAALLCLFSGVYFWRRGNTSAKYYAFAWIILIGSLVSLNVSYALGFKFPYALEALFSAIMLEALMIFTALSHQMQTIKQAHERQAQDLLDSKSKQLEDTQKLLEIERNRAALNEEYKRELERHASVSHDMHQPIQALRMVVAAQRNRVENAEFANDVDTIIDYLDTLLKEVIEETRTKHHQYNHPTPLADVFREVCDINYRRAQEKGLSIRYFNTRKSILTSSVILQRIINNLVSNAVAHIEYGKVLIGVRQKSSTYHIQVIDSGNGIANLNQDNFDKPFFSNTENKDGQFGLGLSIVKMLCTELGYDLTVTSTPNKGTCVSVIVPMSNSPTL